MGLSVRKVSAPIAIAPPPSINLTPPPAAAPESSTPAPNSFNRELSSPGPRGQKIDLSHAVDLQAKSRAMMREFDGKVAAIHAHPAYLAMTADDKKKVDDSIAIARTRPNLNYYADKLLLLLNTKDAPPAATGAMNDAYADASKASAEARLKTPAGKANVGLEEAASADKARKWTVLSGDTATFLADREKSGEVYVKMKVHLNGAKSDVDRVKAMEDDIEKKGSARGYNFDIEFVDSSGPDVFETNVDPTKWVDAGNWSGASEQLAHEAHHRLGLDDRYDYIESHADNADMKLSDRLHWFHVQMQKKPDPEGKLSIMGGGDKLLDSDACAVIQAPDLGACQTERKRSVGVK